jgi:hypothetical protein
MPDATLRDEVDNLFNDYRTHHRNVFLEMAVRWIRAPNATKAELATIREVLRTQRLRPRKRGRPRKSTQTLECGRPHAPDPFGDSHWRFRETCNAFSDNSKLRPFFLKQIRLLVQGANDAELHALGKAVAAREQRGWQGRRGHPDALSDGDLLRKSYQVARLRFCEGKTWDEIRALAPVFHSEENKSRARGRDLQQGLPQRYVIYLQDAIHRTLNPLREQLTPWPGALQEKRLRWYIESQTGLPFRADPACCESIVKALWPCPPLRGYGKKILFPLKGVRMKRLTYSCRRNPRFSD